MGCVVDVDIVLLPALPPTVFTFVRRWTDDTCCGVSGGLPSDQITFYLPSVCVLYHRAAEGTRTRYARATARRSTAVEYLLPACGAQPHTTRPTDAHATNCPYSSVGRVVHPAFPNTCLGGCGVDGVGWVTLVGGT